MVADLVGGDERAEQIGARSASAFGGEMGQVVTDGGSGGVGAAQGAGVEGLEHLGPVPDEGPELGPVRQRHAEQLAMTLTGRQLQFGTVWVNDHLPLVSEMPWTGMKQSGYGRDMSRYAIEDYTQLKHVMAKLS